jgi:hypothetical protein
VIDDNVMDPYRSFAVVMQKGQSHRYGDGTAIENLEGGAAGIAEDSQDSGQFAINYATEPLWFRFGFPPNLPFGAPNDNGMGSIPNAHEAYSNGLPQIGVDGGPSIGDPVTPVFTAKAGQEARMRVLMPTGIGRGTTFNVHGHVWQRDPYLCPDDGDGGKDAGISGKCTTDEVGSQVIGDNPIGISLGGQESVNANTHFEMRLPSAGGTDKVAGDYLYRDQASFGNMEGLWGILRVEE